MSGEDDAETESVAPSPAPFGPGTVVSSSGMASAPSAAASPPPTAYDAAYYAGGCGPHPYRRDEIWMGFFADVADRIVADIGPRTVMDVGCAIGMLVEALRERGVEAHGIDVSEYAISQVPDSVAPYCTLGSALEPLPGRFDLITCIEIVEHLSATDGARALSVLCAHADDILFSSSPSDFDEPTHVNVQPIDHWIRAFARRGFALDQDFDATFISPWAMRFRKARGLRRLRLWAASLSPDRFSGSSRTSSSNPAPLP